jgi:hypothetical protein
MRPGKPVLRRNHEVAWGFFVNQGSLAFYIAGRRGIILKIAIANRENKKPLTPETQRHRENSKAGKPERTFASLAFLCVSAPL